MNLKKHIFLLLFAILFVFTACMEDKMYEPVNVSDNGKLNVSAVYPTLFSVNESRAIDNDTLYKTLNLVISSKDTLVYKRPADLFLSNNTEAVQFSLPAGDYKIEGWAGDSIRKPTFEPILLYRAETQQTIKKGETAEVKLGMDIRNVAVKMELPANLDEKLIIDSIVVKHDVDPKFGLDSLVYSSERMTLKSTGYFIMPAASKTIIWTLRGKLNNGSHYNLTGSFETHPGYLYTLKFNYNSSDSPLGGLYIDVTVVEESIAQEKNIYIRSNPVLEWRSDDEIVSPLNAKDFITKAEAKDNKEVKVVVRSSGELTSVVLASDYFTFGQKAGDIFQLFQNNSGNYKEFTDLGISASYEKSDENKDSYFVIDFTNEFFKKLESVGRDYVFSVVATDKEYGSYNSDVRSVNGVFTISISADKAVASSVSEGEKLQVWDSEMLLKGQLIDKNTQTFGFKYWETNNPSTAKYVYGKSSLDEAIQSRSENCSADVNGNFYAVISEGLKANTNYSYKVVCSDDDTSLESCEDNENQKVFSYVMSDQPQLPNSGFENWSGSKPMLIYGDGQEMFWDSGNHGSSSVSFMAVDLTTADSSIKHNGNYSAKLSSQYVGLGGSLGKFAAGNVFIGKYLETNGMKGAALGWGREFVNRPRKLILYAKYKGVNVDNANGGDLKKGDKDEGKIFIALVSSEYSHGNRSYESKYGNWPMLVDNSTGDDSYLFKETDSGVLGYGEYIFKSDTEGEDMVQIEIPIIYSDTNVRPSHVIMVATSSRCGDYFTGGDGSTMWIDDLELIY